MHDRASQLADAPEIGLRDSARLLNCPDATDDTIGIYAEQMFMNEKNVYNPDGLGAPIPGDAADGVVVAAPAISSELEALAALHQKGALTDSEFAAAKAKLLG